MLLQVTQEEKAQLISQLQLSHTEMDKYKESYESFNLKVNSLQEEVLQNHKEYTKIELQYNRSLTKVDKLSTEQEVANVRIGGLEDELQVAQTNISVIDVELRKATEQLSHVHESSESHTVETTRLQETVVEYESKIVTLTTIEGENQVLKDDLTSLRYTIHDI